jgi:HAL2 family 3'(2'),5'-bisphosphate nucleotidase
MTLQPILDAVRQAALLCREVQHNSLRSMNKLNQDKTESEPVTLADYGSQVILCRALSQSFPDDAVLAEEAGSQFLELTSDKQKAEIINLLTTILDVNVTQDDIVTWLDHGTGKESARTWVIDPIDGTKGFVAMRHYAIGLGIVENGLPVGSIMAAPGYGDGVSGDDEEGLLFYTKDGKAYQEPLLGGEAKEIRVSERTEGLRVVQSWEKKHASKDRMEIVREKAGMADARVDELDSMEKYALVANGDADVYLRLPNLDNKRPHMSWDHAAGVALVLAAGGVATDVDGSPLDFSQGRILPNRGMLVSNGKVHERLIAAVAALLAEEAMG